jgi:hypothetical protein
MYLNRHTAGRLMPMQSGTDDDKVKSVLEAEIDALQKNYLTIREYLAGKQYDRVDVAATILLYKDGLNRVSSHIMTLYVLKGKKVKITWDPLLENLSNASATLERPGRDLRSVIELAFNMSSPSAAEVMAYLAELKESLK